MSEISMIPSVVYEYLDNIDFDNQTNTFNLAIGSASGNDWLSSLNFLSLHKLSQRNNNSRVPFE